MLVAGGNVKHHGASPWHLANQIDQPVFVTVNVKHHGASLWYRLRLQFIICALPTFSWRTDGR